MGDLQGLPVIGFAAVIFIPISHLLRVFLPWAALSDQVCGKTGGTLKINGEEQSATPGDLNLKPL